MQINKIEFKNFASYKDLTTIPVPLGITGIVGTINGATGKSNGSGKSKAVMSILFALFGSGTYDRTEEIWNDKMKPTEDGFVKIDFSLMGNNYTIERGKKAKGGTYLDVYENDKRCGDSVKDAQDYINRVIGRDEKLFMVSNFFSQGDLSSFIQVPSSQRREYLDPLLDLGIWRFAAKTSSKDYKQVSDDITKNQDTLSRVLDKLKQTNQEIATIEVQVNKYSIKEQEFRIKQAEYEKVKNLESTQNSIKEYEKLFSAVSTQMSNLVTRKTGLENNQEQIVKEASAKAQIIDDFSTFDLVTEKASINNNESEISKIRERTAEYEKLLNSTKSSIMFVDAELVRLEKSKKNLVAGLCDRCGKPVTTEDIKKHNDEILSEVDLKAKEKIAHEATFETTKSLLEQDNTIVRDIQGEIHGIQAGINNFNEKYLPAKVFMASADENINKIVEEIDKIAVDFSKLVDDRLLYETKLSELKAELPADLTVGVAELKQQIALLEKELTALNIQKGALQQLQQSVEEYNIECESLLAGLKEANERVSYLDTLGKAFKEIPSILFKKSIGAIEAYANEILQNILPRFKIKIYEDEEKKTRPLIIAFEVDGKYRNFKLLSGGQQSICAIAIRVAISRVIAQKAKVPLNFLVLDEVFGALDEHNREEVLKVLNSLTKYFTQILVITHTGEATLLPSIIHVFMNSDGNSYIGK